MLSEQVWNICTDYHGHDCPGIALGFKMVEAAIEEMGLEGEFPQVVEGLTCVSTTMKCPVDAVRCILGCTEEAGTLEIPANPPTDMDFILTLGGRTVQVSAKPHTFGGRRGMEAIEYVLAAPYTDLVDVTVR